MNILTNVRFISAAMSGLIALISTQAAAKTSNLSDAELSIQVAEITKNRIRPLNVPVSGGAAGGTFRAGTVATMRSEIEIYNQITALPAAPEQLAPYQNECANALRELQPTFAQKGTLFEIFPASDWIREDLQNKIAGEGKRLMGVLYLEHQSRVNEYRLSKEERKLLKKMQKKTSPFLARLSKNLLEGNMDGKAKNAQP
jgi:hypothetical protein